MRFKQHRAAGAAFVLSALVSGCLSAPGAPPGIRYYGLPAGEAEVADTTPSQSAVGVRLKPVVAAAHLREAMAWRSEGAERGLREYERWSERPEVYLDRALREALAQRASLRRTESLAAPALEVRLEAFEEVRSPAPRAEVALRLSLVAFGGAVLLDERVVESATLKGEGSSGEALASALSMALDAAVARALERVAAVLAIS